jgi:hypothetical protein
MSKRARAEIGRPYRVFRSVTAFFVCKQLLIHENAPTSKGDADFQNVFDFAVEVMISITLTQIYLCATTNASHGISVFTVLSRC